MRSDFGFLLSTKRRVSRICNLAVTGSDVLRRSRTAANCRSSQAISAVIAGEYPSLSPAELVCDAALKRHGLAAQICIALASCGACFRELLLETLQSVSDDVGMQDLLAQASQELAL